MKSKVEEMYQLYLNLVDLSEDRMHPQQRKQLREAFVGGVSMTSLYLIDVVGALDEDEALEVLKVWDNDVNAHVEMTMRGKPTAQA